MKILNQIELDEIVENHQHYLNKDCDGWEKLKADLCNTNLSYTDLSCVNLCYADLSYGDLRGVDLRGADLSGADLRYANLTCANLRGAKLCNADLSYANLTCVNLNYTDLNDINLYGTKLHYANLYGADLSCAQGKLIEYRKGKILTNDIVGYKKCKYGIIVTLLIPRGAIVFSINGNKCRTNKAKVVNIDGADRAYSRYKYMSYYVGDEFNIYDFNCEYNVECDAGIHFFINKQDAINY